jgi:hypothetical protein
MAVSFKKGRQLTQGLVLASALLAGQASALAPEHEMRRLMLATEQAVTAEHWGEAGEYLNRLQNLEGNKPADYFYYRGRVMLQAGHLNEAQAALEAYVDKSGVDGSHYQEALQLITSVEKARKEQAQAPKGSDAQASKIAVIEPSGDRKLASLRKLYLADSDKEALTRHLNSLLGLAGWREDKTIVQVDKPADIEYKISTIDSTINVQELRRKEQGQIVRKTESVPVYGINPQVEWGCEPAVTTCWVYDPRNGSRLLQLAFDREQAREIASTLGQLIRNLQAPAGS